MDSGRHRSSCQGINGRICWLLLIFVTNGKGKLGLGTAYIHGFKWALGKGYKHIFEMDADFSHPPEDLIRLHHAAPAKDRTKPSDRGIVPG